MSAFQKLHQEHTELLVLAKELLRLTSRKEMPCKVELFHLRTKLASNLFRHLMEEDWVIYPSLLRSPDPSMRAAVYALQLDSGKLADAFRAHMKRWTAVEIERDWIAYCEEASGLLKSLNRRITREDGSLYRDESPEVIHDNNARSRWA